MLPFSATKELGLFKIYFYFIYLNVFSPRMYVCCVCMLGACGKSEEGIRFPWNWGYRQF